MTPGELMAAEMAEQPGVLEALAQRRGELLAEVREVLPDGPVRVVIVARGSSDHAAVYGRYVLEHASRLPVALAAPSLHTVYGVPTDYSGYVAIAVSQSGETPEIVTVLDHMRAAGACTLAITNVRESPLAASAAAAVTLAAGEERAVPATKTFTAQVAAFALVAEAIGPVPWAPADWAGLPAAVEAVLGDPEPAKAVAAEIGDARGLVAVARGFLFGVALEAALKLKETTSLLAEGYSAADFRHGPIAVVEEGLPVLAFSAAGPAAADVEDLAQEVRRRGGRVFVVSDAAGADLPIPAGVPEALAALPATVRAQQVARELALHRGIDPDAPFGLRKVTPTY